MVGDIASHHLCPGKQRKERAIRDVAVGQADAEVAGLDLPLGFDAVLPDKGESIMRAQVNLLSTEQQNIADDRLKAVLGKEQFRKVASDGHCVGPSLGSRKTPLFSTRVR